MAALAAAALSRPGTAYALGNNLYLALTSRCNATPLHVSRGPGFVLPPQVGYHLVRGETAAFRLPADPRFEEPSAAEAAEVVRTLVDSWPSAVWKGPPTVAFAGLGEPLLALESLLQTVQLVHERSPDVVFRCTTNGLFDEQVALRLASGGVARATVALASEDPRRYARLMQPSEPGRGLKDVTRFISALVDAGVAVEAAVVAAPCVDVAKTSQLARSLGASVRVRSYFA
jgi:pyruvate-formate lyase-activating enzyme